jgi:hypothetical protein
VEALLTVVGFNLVMLALLEIPLVGYTISAESTAAKVARFKAWISREGGRVALGGAVIIGVALLVRGTIELLA